MIIMCPNHGQEEWLILQTFYKGLTEQTRSYVDSAAGGGIMNKTLEEAINLIESMASHNFSWSNERAVHEPQGTMHKISNKDAVAAQVEKFTKQLTQMLTEGRSNESV